MPNLMQALPILSERERKALCGLLTITDPLPNRREYSIRDLAVVSRSRAVHLCDVFGRGSEPRDKMFYRIHAKLLNQKYE